MIGDVLLLLAMINSLTAMSFLLPVSIDFNAIAIASNLTAYGQRKVLLKKSKAAFTCYTLSAMRLLYQRIKIDIIRYSIHSTMINVSIVIM
jgi:hypothetical protein